jgi:hypothetical protein
MAMQTSNEKANQREQDIQRNNRRMAIWNNRGPDRNHISNECDKIVVENRTSSGESTPQYWYTVALEENAKWTRAEARAVLFENATKTCVGELPSCSPNGSSS